MKYFLFGHNGSGNHGCEAIVRGTYEILKTNDPNLQITLATNNINEDIHYGLNKIVNLVDEKVQLNKISLPYIEAYLSLKLLNNDRLSEELCYKKTFESISKDTIAMSIGGDNYCYPGYQRFMMLHDMLHRRGIKTVLWGCSVEPSNIDEEMKRDLCKYDLIIARESLTYNALKLIGANVFLYPDPAFQLDLNNDINLVDGFIEGKTVGINISPMIMSKESKQGITFENFKNLISYIIEKTDLYVALIPHVIWEDNNDDRIPLKDLYDIFKDSNRVCLLEDMNCEKIKSYISKCRYFIGARTHSTIAAYSTCVPTLVIGYSVKAKGIAKDIFGTYENYVLPVQSLNTNVDLVDGFRFIVDNESKIIEMEKKYVNKSKEYFQLINLIKELI